MIPTINKQKTGEQIRAYMNLRGLSVQDVKTYLSLGCVQTVYHWLDGQAVPSLDNLYALSELLRVPMDQLIIGSRKYQPGKHAYEERRFVRYYDFIYKCIAA